ncbi:MAG: MFS transporter, partial [Betaproteobacteria bacterium]|nr:MFS transporter [Betaproteobacteria bacterium]
MKKNLIKLIAGQACLHACMTGMRMAAPLLALRQGSSAAMVGVLLALFALTQVFLALPAGRYADKHGLKRPVMLSVLSSSLGALMAAIWTVFPVLCVSALLSGGATGVAIIALQRHVGTISNFVGPLAAGVVIDVSGFSAAFALLAVFPWFAWFAVRRELPMPASEQAVQDPAKRAWDLLGEPGFRRLLIVNWFLSASWDMHTFVVPLLGHERGLSASAIGAILGGFALCAALIRVVLPWLTKRWQEWQVITLAMLFTCLLLALYPMAQAATRHVPLCPPPRSPPRCNRFFRASTCWWAPKKNTSPSWASMTPLRPSTPHAHASPGPPSSKRGRTGRWWPRPTPSPCRPADSPCASSTRWARGTRSSRGSSRAGCATPRSSISCMQAA